MAGLLRTSTAKFLFLDGAGAVLWAASAALVGYVWRREVESILETASHFGRSTLLVVAIAVLGFAALKYYERRRYYAQLRAARISPAEVHVLLQQGKEVAIVDLRSHTALKLAPNKVPGALLISPEEFEERWSTIPRMRDVVMYCT
jgi:hypothetical protein